MFDHFMQAFNEERARNEKRVDLTAIGNQPRTLAGLQQRGADYFIELIPPGQERNQIKSGCMLLGNEDDRNFLRSPEGVQIYVDGGFSVLTGTEQGERYSFDANGDLVIEQFTP